MQDGGPAGNSLPELHNTIIVAAFEGWNDAGDAASDALEHLDAIWEADPIIEIDDEAYYDYQVNRPVIRQVDGVTRELVWPAMRISHCRPPGSRPRRRADARRGAEHALAHVSAPSCWPSPTSSTSTPW